MFFSFIYILEWYKTQEMWDSIFSEDPFIIVYCPDKHKTQRMFDEAVDNSPAAVKSILNWFVTSKMFEKFVKSLLTDNDILFFNEDINNVTFIANQRHILGVDLDKVNLDNDNKFDENDPDTTVHVRLLAFPGKIEKSKALIKR